MENYLTKFAGKVIPERVEAARKVIVVGEDELAAGGASILLVSWVVKSRKRNMLDRFYFV